MTPALPFDASLGIRHLEQADPVLGEIIVRVGPCPFHRPAYLSPFHALIRSIIYQQLHGKAAATIHERVIALFGNEKSMTPASLLAAADLSLRGAGLSANKLKAIRDLASKASDGTVPTFTEAQALSNDALLERLTAVRGIGDWTVHMLLIFHLGRPDVMPTGDFAIRKAFGQLYRKGREPSIAVILRHARRWQPYRSIASWYLWRSLDPEAMGGFQGKSAPIPGVTPSDTPLSSIK